MREPEVEAPVVPLPGPVERRLRLGPFASTRDALKFVTYAAVGALLAPFVSPYAWLPVLGLGFGVSVWRPDGEAVDERIGRWIGWSWRHLGGTPMTRATARSVSTGNFARLGPGRYATVLRLGGTPVAYRPPADLERMFREYGDVLRASDGVLVLHVGTVPLTAGPLLPHDAPAQATERSAHAGYRELVLVLCHRRQVRTVDLALFGSGKGREVPGQLEARTQALAGRLTALGLRSSRLRGRGLADAAHRMGWSSGERGE
ncbi:MAG: hypothetical protein WB809_02195 [Thermoplasmata archaeon]